MTLALTSSNDFIQALEEAQEFTTQDVVIKGNKLTYVTCYYQAMSWEQLAQEGKNTSVLYQVDEDTVYCVTKKEDSITKRNPMCSSKYSVSLTTVGLCSAFVVNPMLAIGLTMPMVIGMGMALSDESNCESATDDFNYEANKLN